MNRLTELESVIDRAIRYSYEAGFALQEIKEKELYSPDYETFEDYCFHRWGYSPNQVESRIQAAQISATIESDKKPVAQQHYKVLSKVEDVSLRNRVWTEAVKRWDAPTAKQLNSLVTLYEVIEEDELFLTLVESGLLTAKQASTIMEELKDLPPYYYQGFKLHGFTETVCIDPRVFTKLRQIEWTDRQLIIDLLNSGGIEIDDVYIHLYDLTLYDLEKLHKQVIAESIRTRQQTARKKQESKSEIIYGSTIYNGLSDFNIIVPNELTLNDIEKVLELENAQTFAILVFRNGTKVENNGQLVDMKNCNVFPDELLRDIMKHVTR